MAAFSQRYLALTVQPVRESSTGHRRVRALPLTGYAPVFLGLAAQMGARLLKIGDFTMDYRVDDRKTGPAPAALRASAYCWLASALVSGVIPAIVMFLRPPDSSSFAVSMGMLVLLTALQCWAALRLLRGERWARYVLTVVAVLSLAGLLALNDVLAVMGLILSLAGAVLMWLPASSAYVRRSRPPIG
jgi:hypothetical protein